MKAQYLNPNKQTRELDVVKQYNDGTVDLARPGEKEPCVTKCRVTDAPEVGCCVLAAEKKSDEKKTEGGGDDKKK